MGMLSSRSGAAAAAAAAVIAMLAVGVWGQNTPAQSCASKLVPCGPYLGSASPPDSCCGPLKEAVRDELPCLCALYASPEILKAFNINLTQALALPVNCGISGDVSRCSGVPGALSPRVSPPPPPATPGRNKNDAGRSVAWMGMSTLFLFWWSIIT